ncbi:MAG: transglutaminase family protein [Pseudomonadota bacterium]
MTLNIETRLSYDLAAPCDLLLQVEVARAAGQAVRADDLTTSTVEGFRRVDGEAAFGRRAWMHGTGRLDARYRAQVDVTRPEPDLRSLQAMPPRTMTAEATSFLMPSRYVPSDEFEAVVAGEFAGLSGGPMVAAMRDWIADAFDYVPGASGPSTTARETFVQRRGVCRDYAHVLIAFARAGGIPARMVSGYAPDVDPPDFHAVAEVWLEDAWHIVDATGMAEASEMAVIAVGRDAAEVSFLTTMGTAMLVEQSVAVGRA